ncbi:hypothetical protein Rsub_04709 [Raphidocelis subcapitata]|uniref:BAR domain-containing protein n=1 Tax=Raphidocelis subcapitata TaxID=307507 RepID=A0A2V0P4H5_9CHLO|nr:hypothetical protein Rsub_04709 [Raphidocelis subcapitata]|eukprot:GBF91985.1 hypothetical protein Rsub_04709 [Raphidocelis subcapitata]
MERLSSESAPSSERVGRMVAEALSFDAHLSKFQSSSLRFEHATERFLHVLEPILRAPLPRVWSHVEGGLAEPIRAPVSHAHGHTVGGDALFDGLDEARGYFHSKLMGDVLGPVDAWREQLRVVEARMPELHKLQSSAIRSGEKLRAAKARYERRAASAREDEEYEATHVSGEGPRRRRRRGGGGARRNPLTACFTAMPGYAEEEGEEEEAVAAGATPRAYHPGDLGEGMAREVEAEDAGTKLTRKQRKYDALLEDFSQQEALVGSQLGGLARDAAWTKSYAAATLLVAKEAMQARFLGGISVASMGKTKQPLPSFAARRPAEFEGVLRDNLALAAELPEGMEAGRIAAAPGVEPTGMLLLPERVTAHRATAQPLETHARPDVSGLERVATPPAGAADVSLATAQRVAGAQAERRAAAAPLAPPPLAPEPYHERRGYEPPRERAAPPPAPAFEAAAEPPRRRAPEAGAAPGFGDEALPPTILETAAPPAPFAEAARPSAGAAAAAAAGAGGEVCARREFSVVEDRPILKERVERVVEHRPVEKQYVTETVFTGERAVPAATPETPVGPVQERIVEAAEPGPACPAGLRAPGPAGGAAGAAAAAAAAAGEGAEGEVQKHWAPGAGGIEPHGEPMAA